MMKRKRIKMKRMVLVTIPVFAMGLLMFSCQEDEEMTRLENKIAKYENATVSEDEMKYLSDADDVFTIVEEQPIPVGGFLEFYKYINNNIKYPEAAKAQGIEGKVFVQFVIDENGELTSVRPMKGIGAGCDQEAVRVLKESKAWIPGRQDGHEVKVKMILPINFSLNPKPKDLTTIKKVALE